MQISSPCINLCVMDDRFGLCLGCGRSLSEIADWGAMSEAGRGALLPALAARLAALGTRGGRAKALARRARAS